MMPVVGIYQKSKKLLNETLAVFGQMKAERAVFLVVINYPTIVQLNSK